MQLRAFQGTESIGKLFSIDIEAVFPDKDGLDEGDILGADACLVLESDGLERRRFYGMISALSDALDTTADHRAYRLRLVPRAHRLTLVNTQDIYQDVSVPEILKTKLQLLDLAAEDFDLRLTCTYPSREFVVQYRETDLAFISRLAEHLGISLVFEHDDGRDRVVFTDHEAGFGVIEGASVPYRGGGERTGVYAFALDRQLVPSTYIVYDYNYRIPQVEVRGLVQSETGFVGGIAEFGAHIKTPEEGESLARVRRDEHRSTERVYRGESDQPTFRAGGHFTLEDHPHVEGNPLLLVEVEHRATQPAFLHGGAQEPPRYDNSFRAVPSGFTYRPPRSTPLPRIHGFVTGIVEGHEGGSTGHAKLDEEGRYTVRFLFDIAPQERLKASRPLRMAQHHTGAGYGTHFPLRPGVEVLIAFLDGDPDRPVVVGALPNPLTPSPINVMNSGHNMLRTRSGVRLHINDGHTRGNE